MTAPELIIVVIVFIIAGLFLMISIRSFMNRGFLFNNAFIYASKEEREKLNKKPYYRQTAIVFLLLSMVFVIIGLSVVLHDPKINLIEIPLIIAAIIYAIFSTIRIQKRSR